MLTWSKIIFKIPKWWLGGEKRSLCQNSACQSFRKISVYWTSVYWYKIFINMPGGFNSILFISRWFIALFPDVFWISLLEAVWRSEISRVFACRPGENWTATKPWKWRHLQTGLWDHWSVLLFRWCECSSLLCAQGFYLWICFRRGAAAPGLLWDTCWAQGGRSPCVNLLCLLPLLVVRHLKRICCLI